MSSSLPGDLEQQLLAMADDVDAVLEEVVIDSGTNEVFTEQVSNNLVFFGKSLLVWDDELAVALFGDMKPDEIREAYAKLANNIQVASHYYEMAAASNAISAGAIELKKADIITALVAHYHSVGDRVPPSTILERMADGYLRRLSNLGSTSKIVKSFWKGKLSCLTETKNILNSIAISSAIELKHTSGE